MYKVLAPSEDGLDRLYLVTANVMEVVEASGGMGGSVLTFVSDEDVLVAAFNNWSHAWADGAIDEEPPLEVAVAAPDKDRGPKN